VIAAVAAPLLHAYVPPPAAVRVTLFPAQKVVGPDAEIDAVGVVLAVTDWLAVAVHEALVTVTVYVPEVLLVIAAVEAPVLQE
jgi:hypothetical protein